MVELVSYQVWATNQPCVLLDYIGNGNLGVHGNANDGGNATRDSNDHNGGIGIGHMEGYINGNYHGGGDGNCNGNGKMVQLVMVMLKIYMVMVIVTEMVTNPVDQPHHLLVHPKQFRLSSKAF